MLPSGFQRETRLLEIWAYRRIFQAKFLNLIADLLDHYMRLFILWDDFIGEIFVFMYVCVLYEKHLAWSFCQVIFPDHLLAILSLIRLHFCGKGLEKTSECILSW